MIFYLISKQIQESIGIYFALSYMYLVSFISFFIYHSQLIANYLYLSSHLRSKTIDGLIKPHCCTNRRYPANTTEQRIIITTLNLGNNSKGNANLLSLQESNGLKIHMYIYIDRERERKERSNAALTVFQ